MMGICSLSRASSTFAYFHAARACLEAWGKPVAFYSDKQRVFHDFCDLPNGSCEGYPCSTWRTSYFSSSCKSGALA